jgi:hypothetical protein
MKEISAALHSEYIIDGEHMLVTPFEMLSGVSSEGARENARLPESIVDESVDLAPSSFRFDAALIPRYLEAAKARIEAGKDLDLHFAGPISAARVAFALIESIWLSGHFRLGDLSLKAHWHWNMEPVGNMAAFFASVESACSYIDSLSLYLKDWRVTSSKAGSSVVFKAGAAGGYFKGDIDEDDDEESGVLRELPFKTLNPKIGRRRKVTCSLIPDPSDWLIYIPFDTCEYRLGGSAISLAMEARSAVAADVSDADYFIDCFEVVRELVEDGIVKAGATVREGGLITALQGMSSAGAGASIDISDIREAYGGEFPVRVLFAEIPGVVIQVSANDYDYVDAELLLQDIAYFPIGHPTPGTNSITIASGDRKGVSAILESLLGRETSEGED